MGKKTNIITDPPLAAREVVLQVFPLSLLCWLDFPGGRRGIGDILLPTDFLDTCWGIHDQRFWPEKECCQRTIDDAAHKTHPNRGFLRVFSIPHLLSSQHSKAPCRRSDIFKLQKSGRDKKAGGCRDLSEARDCCSWILICSVERRRCPSQGCLAAKTGEGKTRPPKKIKLQPKFTNKQDSRSKGADTRDPPIHVGFMIPVAW